MKQAIRVLSLLLMLWLTVAVFAQDSGAVPAAATLGGGQKGAKSDAGAGDQEQDDTGPPSTANGPLGSLTSIRGLLLPPLENGSALQPFLHFTHRSSTNPCYGPAASACNAIVQQEVPGGSLTLGIAGPRQRFTLGYDGGAILNWGYGKQIGLAKNQSFHDVDLSETFLFRRWTISAADSFQYTPSSSFGFAGSGIPGSFGSSLISNIGSITPTQSVFSQLSSRYADTLNGDVIYQPTLRNSFTASGGYSLMRFPSGPFFDADSSFGQAGYSHLFGISNQVGVTYSYSEYTFLSGAPRIRTQDVLGMWGMRLHRNFTFRAGGGPQQYQIEGVALPIKSTRWAANSTLQYQRALTTVMVTYHRGVTSGSGVLRGATSDIVQGSVMHPIARQWNANFTGGFSENAGLLATQSFRTYYVGASVSKIINYNFTLYLNYGFQEQTTNTACSVNLVACGVAPRHDFGVGITWGHHPIRIR